MTRISGYSTEDSDVEDVLCPERGVLAGLRPGAVVAVHSTVHAKLLNNVLFTANLATAASILALGRSLDVDPAGLGGVIGHGSGNSFALGRIADAGGTLDRIGAHAGHLLRTDVRLMADLAEEARIPAATVMAAANAALALMGQR